MKHKGIGAAAAIFDEQGYVLLVKHTYGKENWELPGGGAEAHESPEETAMREVREETGLEVTATFMTGCYFDVASDAVHFVFRCERQEPHGNPLPDGVEISDSRFWPTEALPRPISDWTVRRIADAVSGRKFALPFPIGERIWLT